MQQGFLKFAAAVLGTGLVVVPFLGLDGLPRDLRRQIKDERAAYTQAEQRIKGAQDEVAKDLQSEADLFRSIPASQTWPSDLTNAATDLQSASKDVQALADLEKKNRRQDRDRATALLARARATRTAALNQATGIEKEADHYVELKKSLPDTLRRMEKDYQMVRSFDPQPMMAQVAQAATDWPDKRSDLESRLNTGIRDRIANDEQLWQANDAARRQAAAGQYTGVDLGSLIAAAEQIHTDSAALPQTRDEILGLVGQLNNSWDKVLVDMDSGDHTWKQKIRTVNTPKDGQTTSDEQWVEVSQAKYDAQKSNLGMSVEHKPLGKYDVEAERVAQPAGMAYIAPPSVGRNQYGYWDHSGGRDFWVFYGQYALMRDLLFNHDYRPIYRGDWDEYRTYQSRGQTYYGRDYGTGGAATQQRYSSSGYARSGGFRDSKYASGSGGGSYSGSKYATPGGNSTPKRFGSGSRPEESRPSYKPSSPSRPRPAPSYRPSPRGRRYGR
jgi:hypothetical protein